MTHYKIITNAIKYLAENQILQPNLAEVSAHVGLSEYHLQRIFSEWVGVSPKQFLQFLTKEYAKKKLRTETVMNTAYACGLSGAGRLHDLMLTWEGMTPGEYKSLGRGLVIEYGICDSPFGFCSLAVTKKGICWLAFFDTNEERKLLEKELHEEWCYAELIENQHKIAQIGHDIFAFNPDTKKSFKLLLKGSPFQLKVWEALLAIPNGELVAYQDVASAIQSKAVRAVASAIGQNNISYLIPCHRVIRQTGEFGQYRWSATRKQAIIAWEACRR